MNKYFATIVAGSLLFVSSVAHADDGAASVIAERRALKPGAGLYVVDTTIDVKVGRTFVKDAKGFSVPGGWAPQSLEFDLWGKSDSANAIAVKWKDGARVVLTTECQSPDIDESKDHSGHWHDQDKVRCDVKDGGVAIARTGTFEAEIYLRVAGKPEQLLRKITFAVGSTRSIDSPTAIVTYFVDHDYKLAETVGYWDWDAASLHLRTFTKQGADIDGDGKLRCTMNGAPLGKDGTVSPGGGMGLHVHDGAHDKDTYWIQLDAAVYLPRSSGKWQPGKYECQMIVAAKVLRTIRFQLDAKLGFVTSSEQQPRAGAIASRTTFLPDFDIPAGIDQPFSRAAFGALAMSGRPWLGTAPAAAASASNVSVLSAPIAAEASAAPVTPAKAKGPSKGRGKGKLIAKRK